jgi:hypothetical protein
MAQLTVIVCPRAKTDMTPCVARDGKLAICEIHHEATYCVGCERNVAELFRDLVKKYVDAIHPDLPK